MIYFMPCTYKSAFPLRIPLPHIIQPMQKLWQIAPPTATPFDFSRFSCIYEMHSGMQRLLDRDRRAV
jgi:hypothetical protein